MEKGSFLRGNTFSYRYPVPGISGYGCDPAIQRRVLLHWEKYARRKAQTFFP